MLKRLDMLLLDTGHFVAFPSRDNILQVVLQQVLPFGAWSTVGGVTLLQFNNE